MGILLDRSGQVGSQSAASANKKQLEPARPPATPQYPADIDKLPERYKDVDRRIARLSSPPTPSTIVPERAPRAAGPETPIVTRRPTNGEEFVAGSSHGKGKLTIVNGAGSDAVVMLHKGRDAERAIYVPAGETAILERIAHSSYSLTFESGEDWSDEQRAFTRQVRDTDFLSVLDFTERRQGNIVRWTNHRITLHPVAYGNARTSDLATGPQYRPKCA